ncbi:MAG: tetratricopeptide repeat protein, partial [Candidatus Levyibacteriota bacterium]
GMIALLLSTKKTITWKALSIITTLLLLSLLTKETGALFIFMILLFQVLIISRTRALIFIPYVFTSIVCYLFVRFGLAKVYLEKNEFIPLGHFSLVGRVINIPEVVYYYIKSLFYPAKLSIDQLWTVKAIDFQHFYYPLSIDLLFFFCISLLGVYLYKTHRHLLKLFFFFLVWFLVGLSMLLQLYPLDMTVAERWFYFPIVGLLGLLGIAIQSTKATSIHIKKTSYIIGVCVLLAFSIRTMIRNVNWVDAITLYSHDATISDNFDIENNLGAQLAFAHEYKAALLHIKMAVEEYPHDTNLYDLGYVYEQLGDYLNAKKYYELVLTQQDTSRKREEVLKNTYAGLARVLTLHDKPQVAKAFLQKAIRKYPDDGSYWAYLALCEYSLDEQQDALASAEKAKILLPNATTNTLYNRIKNKQVINVKYLLGYDTLYRGVMILL